MNVLTKTIQGKTLRYTRMGLGLAALGRPGYVNLGHGEDMPADRTKEVMYLLAINVLDAAWAAGVRYFDVARSYGLGEQFLQGWLRIRNIPPEEVTISSKWGYTYTANWKVEAEHHEVKEHTLATLRRQVGESTSLLGPWLRLYQIHSATPESGVLENTAVLDELARLRDGGMLIGLSLSGTSQSLTLEKALSIQRAGTPLFSSVQATWNLLEPSVGPMLAAAHQAGWFTIIKEGLANGRLTDRGQPEGSTLRDAATANSTTIDALALGAILQQPFVDVVLSGAGSVQQLQSNLLAERLNEIPGFPELTETPNEYWKKRSNLIWN